MCFTQRVFAIILIAALLLGSVPATPARAAANIAVSNNNDSGAGSLRQAILDVDSGGTITFNKPLTGGNNITLTSAQLLIEKSLTIDASGAGGPITIDGDSKYRIFKIQGAITVGLKNLVLQNGYPADQLGYGTTWTLGGAIYSAGAQLTVTNCTFTGNKSQFNGGAINSGGSSNTSLTVHNSTFTNNQSGYVSGDGSGGAIQAEGGLAVEDSTFSGNAAGSYGGAVNHVDAPDDVAHPLLVQRSSFDGNTAYLGGHALYLYHTTATVVNSSFRSTVVGHAVVDAYVNSPLTMLNNTLWVDGAMAVGMSQKPSVLINNIVAGSGVSTGFSEHQLLDFWEGWGIGSHNNLVALDRAWKYPPGAVADSINADVSSDLTWDAATGTIKPDNSAGAAGAGRLTTCTGTDVDGKDQRGVSRSTLACAIGSYDASYSVSGSVQVGGSNLAGAVVTATGGTGVWTGISKSSASTGSDGAYTVTNLPFGWSGTLSPSKNHYQVSASQSVTFLDADLTSMDVTLAAILRTITGNAGVGDALLSYNDGGPQTVTADAGTGAYTITVPDGWSGTVTPSKAGYAFVPNFRAYNTPLSGNQTGQDFSALVGVTISGRVKLGKNGGLNGITINATGTGASVGKNAKGMSQNVSGSDGKYTMTVPVGWTGTLAADTFIGYNISTPKPITKSVTKAINVDLTATAALPTDITLSSLNLADGATGDALRVGFLTPKDANYTQANPNDVFTYEVVIAPAKSKLKCDDVKMFEITHADGKDWLTWVIPDLQNPSSPSILSQSSYSVCVQVMDATGGIFTKAFTVKVAAMEGFEGTPANWQLDSGSEATAAKSSTGAKSLLQTSSGTATSATWTIVFWGGRKNDAVTLNWSAYTPNTFTPTAATCYLQLGFYNMDELVTPKKVACPATKDAWKSQSLKLTSANDFTHIRIALYLAADGSIYYDDFALTK